MEKRNRAEGLYLEWGFIAIYFVMIPVIICFVQVDGKLEVDRVFKARALYWALQACILWWLSDCVQILAETWISCQRVQVLIRTECGMLFFSLLLLSYAVGLLTLYFVLVTL